jgi:adenosylcobinamide kinase/adenosylcobinamide-phosphate guanylyltransferase
MSLTLLLGGARSGKSRHAIRLAAAEGQDVCFVATAEARDPELADRIARHRAERPLDWPTIEEPVELREAIERAPASAVIVLDCLSLWVANLLERGWSDEEVEAEAGETARIVAARGSLSVAVSNEVGLGIVPAFELGRRYRDVLGRVNAAWADAAEHAFLVVAGRLLTLERAADA